MGSLQTRGAAAADAAALVSTRRRRPRLGSGRAEAPRRGGLDNGRSGDCSSPTWRPRDGARQDGVAHQPGARGAISLRAPRLQAAARWPLDEAAVGNFRGGFSAFLNPRRRLVPGGDVRQGGDLRPWVGVAFGAVRDAAYQSLRRPLTNGF